MKVLNPEIVAELLRRYGVHAPVTDERFLSHTELQRGHRLNLEVVRDERGKRRLLLNHAGSQVSCECPVRPDTAMDAVQELCASGIPELSVRARATLAHLLVQCASLCDAENLALLRLDPIYLRDTDYRVLNVEASTNTKLRLKKRLMPAAHDAGAVYAYRPTARLR